MAFKNQLQTSAICNLCRKHQAGQHHEILSCNVTKNLFDRFQILSVSILNEHIYEKEMVFGLEICEKLKYRKVPKETKEFRYLHYQKHYS